MRDMKTIELLHSSHSVLLLRYKFTIFHDKKLKFNKFNVIMVRKKINLLIS